LGYNPARETARRHGSSDAHPKEHLSGGSMIFAGLLPINALPSGDPIGRVVVSYTGQNTTFEELLPD